jgi:RNA polymerase sigma-70 factor (ECF subfamily)
VNSDVDAGRITALVIAAQAGQPDSFAQLYNEFAPIVRHVVSDNVHERADVDDVVQEVFTRAYQRLARLREPDRFRPWLLSIARNAAIDHRRVRVAARVVPDPEAGVVHAGSAPDPHESAIIRDELAAAQRGMALLTRRDALALDLVAHLGFGPAEVGAVLGVSPGAAKVVVHRARQRLRDVLGVADPTSAQAGDAAHDGAVGDVERA